jgi:hypothetical protein
MNFRDKKFNSFIVKNFATAFNKTFFWQNLEIFAETILAEPTLLGSNAPIVFSPLSETTVFVRWLYCDQWQTEKAAMGFYVWQKKRERELINGETGR